MIRVGLIDGPVAADLTGVIAAERRFTATPEAAERQPHASRVARVILHHAPMAALLLAEAFGRGGRAEAGEVAAALRWLTEAGARLVNLSLGLRQDRADLRAAVAEALESGLILVGAVPARGGPVYPAAYPGVLRVTGDARCAPGEISALGGTPADYGAAVTDRGGTPRGASLAAAHASGLLAAGLARGEGDPHAILAPHVRYVGRERRRSPA